MRDAFPASLLVGSAAILAGCGSVRAVPSPLSPDDARMVSSHAPAGRCVVAPPAGADAREWDVHQAAWEIERCGVFREVVVDPAHLTLDVERVDPQMLERARTADWRIEVLRLEGPPRMNCFWNMTPAHALTLGLIPMIESGDDRLTIAVRPAGAAAAVARTVTHIESRAAVCGWVAYLLSLLPSWETEPAREAERLDADRLAIELIQAMAEWPPAAGALPAR